MIDRGEWVVDVVHTSAPLVSKSYFPDVPKQGGALSVTWPPAGMMESLAPPPTLLRAMETDRIGSS